MDMNDQPDAAPDPASPDATTPDPAALDDLAAYAVDAHDPEDAPAIEAHLLAAPAAARWERLLRAAAGEYAAVRTREISPPPALRRRVLDAALARRAPAGAATAPAGPVGPAAGAATPRGPVGPAAGAPAVQVHRIELQRAVLLLRGLRPHLWSRPVDPPEMAGWSVHDLAVHLAANESLLARTLGVPVAGVPETAGDNEARTAAAQARHRSLPPGRAVDELEAAAAAVDTLVAAGGGPDVEARIDWWGRPTPVRVVLLLRAFETWTHADDVRRAVGVPMRPPPRASLRTMARAASGWLPAMLAARGLHHPGRVVRLRFPDLDSTGWDVNLSALDLVEPAGHHPVDAEITVDALALCRGAGNRLPPGGLPYTAQGDATLVRQVVAAVPALAVL